MALFQVRDCLADTSYMRKLFVLLLVLLSTSSLWAECPQKNYEKNVVAWQIESVYQLHYAGNATPCELRCREEKKCVSRCQRDEGLRALKQFLITEHGAEFTSCHDVQNVIGKL